MTATSVMIGRRFSPATRLRLQLVFARAVEALAETYQQQAAEFVRRLKSRLTVDEALQRYFREVGVPATIEETVRSRALISLAGLIENPPKPESRASGWTILRPDQLIEALRRRVQHVEETNLDCRLAASMSDEAVAATHVRMALETAEVLAEEVTPDQAIMLYVRTFNLPSIDAQGVFRTAMSQWAELHPLPGEPHALLQQKVAFEAETHPKLGLLPRREFGLRVMV
ncbi:MAG TPA: hypothetical protein VFD73_03845 [Gemmatimonadales bacterium]|jgi:hypothetical protein|nr:hypothetical protein [Gemmatimonadales bacterium]